MARIRTIKPEFFRHELLQDLEANNPGKYPMMVFEGLWGHCDANGVFEWRPRQLKLDILPFLPFDMETTLEILHESGMIIKYSVDSKQYGQVPTFREHQRLSGKEAQDGERFPQPAPGNTSEAMGKQRGSDGEILESQEGKGREGKGKEQEGGLGETNHLPVDNSNQEPPPPEPEEETPPPDAPSEKALDAHRQGQKPEPSRTKIAGHRWTQQQSAKIDELANDIGQRWGMRFKGEVDGFVRANFHRKNPEAVIKVVERLVRDKLSGKSIAVPARWLEAALDGTKDGKAGENQKAEAEAWDREQAAIKAPVPGEIENLGAILQRAACAAGRGP